MNTIREFQDKGYVFLQNFLNPEICKVLTDELKQIVENKQTVNDSQCPLSEAIYGAKCFDDLLEQTLPYIEVASGKKLFPTYSYARLYAKGDELKNHVDRESCEISVTLTLGYDGKQWAIYMADDVEKTNASEILMNVGDAVLYKGLEKWHWREKFEGEWQAQVFLHYVDANGKYADYKFDNRGALNVTAKAVHFTCYDDILTENDCDKLIELYSNEAIERELPFIGNGNINREIRDVERVPLSTHKGLGARLGAAGFDANYHHWKFDVERCNQAEFLIYNPKGRYKSHLDTFVYKDQDEARKVTVLAFLNDDFEGGKFFIQFGNEKFYPPQTKGTVLAFPSFLLHGVDEVTSGTRYTAVSWLTGKWFK